MLHVPNGNICPVPFLTPQAPAIRLYPATSLPRRGRILMFSSLGDGEDQWLTAPFTPFTIGARADGWECVQIHRPNYFCGSDQTEGWYDIRDDPAHGSRYAQTVVDFQDRAVDLLEIANGALPTVVIGLSMGGWNTLQQMLRASHRPVGYISVMSPSIFTTVIGNLYAGLDTTGMDISDTFCNSFSVPGMVLVGSLDNFTQPEHLAAMGMHAIAAGSPVHAGRVATDGVITGGTSWSSATCPLAVSESGASITGAGIPNGTTITVTSAALPHAAPYTGTLSQTCTNGTGLTATFPGLCDMIVQNHGIFVGDGTAAKLLAWLQATIDPLYPQAL